VSQFHVALKRVVDDSYDIEIGRDLFALLRSDLKKGLGPKANKYAILTDSTVKKLYADKLLEDLKKDGLQVELFTFPAGEKSKTRETKALLEDQMLEKGFGRDSCVIALGGGVVTDLAGFLAGTFNRGIPYINFATTLLAAADASVGGKTAVDTPRATNLIGLFHQPLKVYIDVETWKTLPVREISSGLAETIKHACIADSDFFSYLEKNMDKVISPSGQPVLDPEVLEHIAHKNCEVKYNVVVKDEKEANLRQVLNLGHTAGRAIETLSGYSLLHGEALAIGLVVQVMLAKQMSLLSEEQSKRVIQLLKRAGLPTKVPDTITPTQLMDKLYTDKKVREGRVRFVLQDGIGKVKRFEDGSYSTPLTEAVILEAIQAARAETLNII
jgi:3-dehydroquinate synthase